MDSEYERIPLTEEFSALTEGRITGEIGRSYLCIKCEECASNVPVMPDSSDGRNQRPFTDGGGKFERTCQGCGALVSATGAQVFSHHWTQSDQAQARY